MIYIHTSKISLMSLAPGQATKNKIPIYAKLGLAHIMLFHYQLLPTMFLDLLVTNCLVYTVMAPEQTVVITIDRILSHKS